MCATLISSMLAAGAAWKMGEATVAGDVRGEIFPRSWVAPAATAAAPAPYFRKSLLETRFRVLSGLPFWFSTVMVLQHTAGVYRVYRVQQLNDSDWAASPPSFAVKVGTSA